MRNTRLPVSISTLLFMLAMVASAPAQEVSDQGAFRDDFDTLDRDRWMVSDGWANGEHQSCLWSKDRVSVGDGILTLSLTDDPLKDRDYSCAEIQTNERFSYGTYEARMKVPFASGTNSNLFSHVGAPQKKPHNEIDFEFLGKQDGLLQTNYFVDGEGQHEEVIDVPDADDQFQTYSFVWMPDRIQWFIDGRMIREVTEGEIPEENQKIYLSIWSTDQLTDWLGEFRYPGAPLNLEVDWLAFTPQGAPCQFPESVACKL